LFTVCGSATHASIDPLSRNAYPAGPAPTIGRSTDDSFTPALDAQAIVEVVVLVGYYRLLAQSMDVFAIGVPTE
jgi:hypothetical protein